jgi:hypothetical protein
MATIVIPNSGVAEYVAELARKHGVQYVRTADDALAEVITRLADDEIETDETEDLIVALSRAHVIDGEDRVALLYYYLNEKKIRARAAEVLGDSASAERWLQTPLRSIGGVSPASLLNTADGRQLVLDTLGRIEQGIVA